jgi:GNAT superfamily N-acetyltransferase
MLMGDIPGVIDLQRRAFPKMPSWTANQLESHLQIFPEGQIVASDAKDFILGSASSLIVDSERFNHEASWDEITGYSHFKTHAPHGDTLYGADIGVDPAVRGLGIGAMLYTGRKAIVEALNLKSLVAGGRIPGYGAVAHLMDAETYVAQVLKGKRHDPVLGFQVRNGFQVRGLIPGYWPADQASCGYATLIEWPNPAYDESARSQSRLSAPAPQGGSSKVQSL